MLSLHPTPEQRGSRRSVFLAVSFTALLCIMVLLAAAVWKNARTAQGRIAALHETHLRAGAALSAVRANAYLIGILTRDYLLDGDPTQTERYVSELMRIRQITNEQFKILESLAEPGQKAAVERLKEQFDRYWDPTEVALDWTPEEKRAQRVAMLRQRLGRRKEVFALATEVERLLTANFERERERIGAAEREFGISLGWLSAGALLLGAAVAVSTLVHLRRLEGQSQRAESELRRLSGQLRSAQEQERKFLSRELHDQVGQMLTAVRMELSHLARLHGNADSEVSARIAAAKGVIEEALRMVRNIAMLLRPSMLDDLGLVPALQWLIREMTRSSGIVTESWIAPELDRLPEAHRTCIYRVVQEALTNAVRHSAASRIQVKFLLEMGELRGWITDNGRGFDARRTPKALGLLGMEERVRELGGTLIIDSEPGKGTRIELRLLVPETPKEGDDSDSDSGRSRHCAGRVETST